MKTLAIRPAEPEDLPLILDSWLDSFRYSRAAGLINMKRYREIYTIEINHLLARPEVNLLVAYHPGETDRIADLYGWICYQSSYETVHKERIQGKWTKVYEKVDSPLIHYVYTKQGYRGRGIARRLMRAANIDHYRPFVYSYTTSDVKRLENWIPKATWKPMLARFDSQLEKE